MAGSYLEFYQQDSYSLTSNVLLNGVAQELYLSVIWFTATQDQNDAINTGPFISLSTNNGGIAISNGIGSNINSIITVTINSALTASCNYVNAAFWSLVVKTPTGSVYTVDRGRCAVVPRYATQTFQ